MTNEEALRCLANKPSDPEGLEALYAHNRTVVDAAIKKWFGRSPVVPQAIRHVLGRIAARTDAFKPEHQTPDTFVARLVDEESRLLFEEIENRLVDWRRQGHANKHIPLGS